MSTRESGMARNVPARGNVTNGVDRILSKPRCRVGQSFGQLFSDGVAAAVSFDNSTAVVDTDGFYNPAISRTRVTIRTAGTYDVKSHVVWPVSAAGSERSAWIHKNGSATIRYGQDYRAPLAGEIVVSSPIETMQLDANDYLELIGFQISGGNLTTTTAVSYSGEILLCLIST